MFKLLIVEQFLIYISLETLKNNSYLIINFILIVYLTTTSHLVATLR